MRDAFQHRARKDLFNELNNRQIRLATGWITLSIDFIANLQIDGAEIPHVASTKLKQFRFCCLRRIFLVFQAA